ncbi:MAG: o-succinylbenzoate synthase [Acidimicrobiales bacterium]
MSCEAARQVEAPISVHRVRVLSVEIPLITQFRTAYGKMGRKRSVIVQLEDGDGVLGWAEAPGAELPTFSPDTHDSTWYALTKLLVPRVAGRKFDSPAALVDSWKELVGYRAAKHALECAAWAVTSEKLGRPLGHLWGGVRDAVPVGESFGIRDTIEELQEDIRRRLAEGYCRIKLKIAPGWDVEVVRSVAEAFPAVPLTVDGNTGYRFGPESPWAEIDQCGLLMIEQPFQRDALTDHADLQRRLHTAICLDESCTSPGTTRAALRLGAARIINIKPPRVGGPLAAMEIHDVCAEAGVPVWCGGMLETGIGRGFNLAMASLPNFTLPADMSPAKLFYAEDLVDPSFDIGPDGTIPVPTGLGCGFTVAEDLVAKHTTETWVSE